MKESHGYDVNSGAGLVILCPKTRRMLLALRSGSEEHKGGTWCGFGGMMQNEESPLQAALRETMEESEITPNNTIKQAVFVDSTGGKGEAPGFNFYSFIATVNDECCPKINDEHKDYNWYRLSELQNINLHPGVKRMMADAGSAEQINHHLCKR